MLSQHSRFLFRTDFFLKTVEKIKNKMPLWRKAPARIYEQCPYLANYNSRAKPSYTDLFPLLMRPFHADMCCNVGEFNILHVHCFISVGEYRISFWDQLVRDYVTTVLGHA